VSNENGIARYLDGQLTHHILRRVLSLQKMEYVPAIGTMIYRPKMHTTLKRKFQVIPGTKSLQLLIQRITETFHQSIHND